MICFFFIGRYNATPSLRALSFTPHPPTPVHITNICTFRQFSFASLCIVIALDVLVFTVERFQQTKHRKISVFFKCMLFTVKSLCEFPSFARKRSLSLRTSGGPKCLHRLMHSLCFSRASSLRLFQSHSQICTKRCSFFFSNTQQHK